MITERERERERAKVSINPNKWEEIPVNNHFQVQKTQITRRENIKPGKFIHIKAKNTLNGYESSANEWTEDGGVISIEAYSGGSFYQDRKFITSAHDIEKLWPKDKELNQYTAFFLIFILDQRKSKYSYGRMRNLKEVKKEKLLLPTNKDKEIDWKYMENVVKIFYREVVINFEEFLNKVNL